MLNWTYFFINREHFKLLVLVQKIVKLVLINPNIIETRCKKNINNNIK